MMPSRTLELMGDLFFGGLLLVGIWGHGTGDTYFCYSSGASGMPKTINFSTQRNIIDDSFMLRIHQFSTFFESLQTFHAWHIWWQLSKSWTLTYPSPINGGGTPRENWYFQSETANFTPYLFT